MPLIKKGGLALSKEVVRGAAGMVEDMENEVDLNKALKARGSAVVNNLTKRALAQMSGSGYIKSQTKRRKVQSSAKRSKKQTKRKSTTSKKRKTLKKKPTKNKKTTSKPRKHLYARQPDFFTSTS